MYDTFKNAVQPSVANTWNYQFLISVAIHTVSMPVIAHLQLSSISLDQASTTSGAQATHGTLHHLKLHPASAFKKRKKVETNYIANF